MAGFVNEYKETTHPNDQGCIEMRETTTHMPRFFKLEIKEVSHPCHDVYRTSEISPLYDDFIDREAWKFTMVL